jgi:hypothetical protein
LVISVFPEPFIPGKAKVDTWTKMMNAMRQNKKGGLKDDSN